MGNLSIMGATFFQISVVRGNGPSCWSGIVCQGPEAGQDIVFCLLIWLFKVLIVHGS